MVRAEPDRFFNDPPILAKGTFRGRLDVFLDTSGEKVDWDEITAIAQLDNT